MKFMGSKGRLFKYMLPIIESNRDGKPYVEPFVGGCNSMDLVDGVRIGSDIDYYIIELWKGLQRGETIIKEIPKGVYNKARTDYNNGTNNHFNAFEIGWIGRMASFNGRFFDGGYSGKTSTRDYIDEQIRNTLRQVPMIKDVEFIHCDYRSLVLPKEAVIYCDIPYKGKKQQKASLNFNHADFWNWCREKKEEGYDIFVSEYSAPDDFKCVWSMQHTNSMATKNTKYVREKLFTL